MKDRTAIELGVSLALMHLTLKMRDAEKKDGIAHGGQMYIRSRDAKDVLGAGALEEIMATCRTESADGQV